MSNRTVFGYRHVAGIPLCPCRDPGNYVCMLTSDEGVDTLQCWCGRMTTITWESPEERAEFVALNMEGGQWPGV